MPILIVGPFFENPSLVALGKIRKERITTESFSVNGCEDCCGRCCVKRLRKLLGTFFCFSLNVVGVGFIIHMLGSKSFSLREMCVLSPSRHLLGPKIPVEKYKFLILGSQVGRGKISPRTQVRG